MTLYIGSMMPDRTLEESELIKGITKIAANLTRLNEHLAQKRIPILDIVFLLPSRYEKAEFTGMRLHSFDRSEHILRIEAAVPENMVDSGHAERYAIAVMQDAVDAAQEYFFEQNILFDAAGHMALIDFIAPNQKQTALN
ncbi:MAG: hypothetical protein ACU837_13000 [Gammaproteobacteria bacterium]